MKTKTKFQKTHHPVSRVEVLCIGRQVDHKGCCVMCGRKTSGKRDHKPNQTGALGWVETFSDGSVFVSPPAK